MFYNTTSNVKVISDKILGLRGRFEASSQNFEKRLFAALCPSVRPSARTEQFGSHWVDFHEI